MNWLSQPDSLDVTWADSIRFDRFYPLVAYQTQHFANGNSTRSVVRNPFIRRFPREVLERLYARQVGKLLSRKMKPLMDLPYSISDIHSSSFNENPAAEAEYERWSWPYYRSRLHSKPKAKPEIDGDQIDLAEVDA